jgi:uncharacterized protein YciI
MAKLTAEERETIITFCEADDYFVIDTSYQVHIRKFDKLGYECTGTQLYDDGSVMAKQYKVPKFAIVFRKPVKHEMTEEQRQNASERMKKLRANR